MMTSSPPEIEELENLLSAFQFEPGDRFHRRMANAPWRQSRSQYQKLQLRPALIMLLVVFLILGAGFILSPLGEGVAQRLWQYFYPETADRMNVPITLHPTVNATGIDANQNFNHDIQQVEAESGFPLISLESKMVDLRFDGAQFDPDSRAVRMRYQTEFGILFFTQREDDQIDEYASIGAGAPVEQVWVGSSPAELVRGGWRFLSSLPTASASPEVKDTPVVPVTVSVPVIWDAELARLTLRWKQEDRYFELLAIGNDWSHEVLIGLAEEVK